MQMEDLSNLPSQSARVESFTTETNQPLGFQKPQELSPKWISKNDQE
jgi:hypothetical protein